MSSVIENENFESQNSFLSIQLNKIHGGRRFVVVDIGAYNGASCIELAKKFKKKDIIIYAIEPYVPNFGVLRRNVARYRNIIPLKRIISNKKAYCRLYAPIDMKKEKDIGKCSQAASMYQDFAQEKMVSKAMRMSKTQFVSTQTLEYFCKRHKIKQIDLLKINCEGGEYKIFDQNSGILNVLNNVNNISLSLHGKTSKFCSKEYVEKKKEINQLLRKDFKTIYGYDLNIVSTSKIPSDHINQVWIRKKFI